MEYIELKTEMINHELFAHFRRHQIVSQCWRKIDDKWCIKDIAQPVRSATTPSRLKIGLISFARFMSTSTPIKACNGSKIKSFAFSLMMVCSMRSSVKVKGLSKSLITTTLSYLLPSFQALA
jgi:hypothetical protein